MQPLATALMLIASFGADTRRGAYEAIVERNDAQVFSGPGEDNYATGLLHRGTRVTVLRHDPGGWCMISAPEGSFNLVREDYVSLTGRNRGEIREFNVPMYIGSELDGNRYERYHQNLSPGNSIEILGKVTVKRADGRLTGMYKIAPPRGEVRWVRGQTIVAADGSSHGQQGDPFDKGERFERNPPRGQQAYEDNVFHDDNSQTWDKDDEPHHPHPGQHPHNDFGDDGHTKPPRDFGKKPITRTKDGVAVRRNYPEQEELEADRARLQALDDRFREIIDRDAATWDFRELEQDYRKLQEQVSVPALASQIQLRFGAIEHYRELKHAYHDYVQLTSETSRRDAQLLSLQRQGDPNPGGIAYHPVAPEYQPGAPPWGTAGQPSPGNVPYPMAGPVPAEQFPTSQGPALADPEQPVPSPIAGPTLGAPIAAPEGTVAPPNFASPQQMPSPTTVGAPYGGQTLSPSQYPVAPPAGSYIPTQQAAPRSGGQFDGAGIIQRAVGTPPGAPQHVLLTPSGRVLAYLQPTPGVNLDAYVGRAMGLYGQRAHDPNLQGDLLIVNSAVPVRLKQP